MKMSRHDNAVVPLGVKEGGSCYLDEPGLLGREEAQGTLPFPSLSTP